MVLLTVLRKTQLKENQVRVLILGLDNAGKSTIVSSALGESLEKVQPTLGFRIKTMHHGPYTLNLWDVGGQQSLRPFWHNYFEKTDFLVWVVDATAPERLQSCRDELHALLTEDQLMGAGLLVWINKLDTITPQDRENVIHDFTDALELQRLDSHHNYKVLGCSAYTNTNIMEGLEYITEEVKSRLFALR